MAVRVVSFSRIAAFHGVVPCFLSIASPPPACGGRRFPPSARRLPSFYLAPNHLCELPLWPSHPRSSRSYSDTWSAAAPRALSLFNPAPPIFLPPWRRNPSTLFRFVSASCIAVGSFPAVVQRGFVIVYFGARPA